MFNRQHRQFSIARLVVAGALFIFALAAGIAVTYRGFIAGAAAHNSKSQIRNLSFEARVEAQRAIEEVYHRHRIWPADNPQPKPPLDAVLTEDALRAKVDEYLRMTRALEVYAARPVTAADLQAEIERQARATHQPEVLRELWAALGNDPLLVAECLARPLVAERELRLRIADCGLRNEGCEALGLADSSNPQSAIPNPQSENPQSAIHNPQFEEWWPAVRGALGVDVMVPEAEYRLVESAAVAAPCGGELWIATNTTGAPSMRADHSAVWTGSEMIVWGSGDNAGGRYNPATDSWAATNNIGAPSARSRHTAVWTGSEMIVWGGVGTTRLDTGGRYNPATNSWTATKSVGAPGPRQLHTAVWTGSEMIIWGGNGNSDDVNTGGRYNPMTDSWTVTNTTGAPSPREFQTAVWTGSEMIVWGGFANGAASTGGRYNPATDSWITTTTNSAPGVRLRHTAVWTGSEMIVFGGDNNNGSYFSTGGRYNPATDSWMATNNTGTPSARHQHTAVWTGSEVIVWGGFNGSVGLNTGGRYNLTTDSWTAISTTGAPSARSAHTAVWTGREMIVWGAGGDNTGGRYSFALPLTISQITQSFPTTGGTGNIAVTAQDGCTWTATTNANWLTITAGSSVAGNGMVAFTVAANTLGPRTGLITINNQTFTVTQAGVATPRVVRVAATSAAPGSSGLAVPIELVAQGDENALGFTLSFDPALLSSPQASLGADAAGAQLATVTTQTAQGRIGIGLALAAGQKFAAGTRQIAVVTFNLAATAAAGMTTLDFGDQPLQREVSDASAVAIPAAYTAGSVTVVPGYEADVTPRPNGSNNGTLTITDWVQVGRFAAGLDVPAAGAEFQRADCAPRDTKGDGRLTITDWVQAGRYLGTDPALAAGGPTQPVAASSLSLVRNQTLAANRSASMVYGRPQQTAESGERIISIELDANGSENALGFSLRFDAAKWRLAGAEAGRDATGATLHVNELAAKSGRVGVALALPTGRKLAAGLRQMVTLRFVAAGKASADAMQIEFADAPVAREVVDEQANALPASYFLNNAATQAPRNAVRRR